MKKNVKKTKPAKLHLPDRSRVEQSLRDLELRYRRLFETTQDGILILDAKTGAITDVNPYLIDLLGYSREEFVEKKIWQVGAFKDIEASKDAFEALQQNEYIRYENLPLKAKDGRLIQVEFVSNVYLVGDEQVIQCNIRDITEHRRLVAALQENERKYHALVNQSLDGIFLFDLSGNFSAVNKAMCDRLGFSEEELRAMNIWDIVPEQHLDQYRKKLTKILDGESLNESSECTVRGKAGKTLFIDVLSAPYYSEKGIIGFQGIARDITARKEAEEALRASKERFRVWIENSSDIITVVGLEGTVQYASPSIERLLGYKPEEWIGTNAFDWMHPDDRARVTEIFAQFIQTPGSAASAEFRLGHRDGSWRMFESVGRAYLDEHGQMAGLINSRDITARKRAEEEIERYLTRLQALHQIDNAISGSVDLRITLNVFLDHATTQLGVDAAGVLVLNPHTQLLDYTAARGFSTPALQHTHLRVGDGLAGRVALARKTIAIADLNRDINGLARYPSIQSEGFVSYYGVPLIAKGRVNGVLEVFRRTPIPVDQDWKDFLEMMAGQAAITVDNAELFGNLQRSNFDLALAYDSTIEGWSHALDLRDKETEGHTQRVTEVTLRLARAAGITESELVHVRRGALLHDIGKMGVPDYILLKPDKLTDEEWVEMRKHPVFAYELLSPIAYLRPALDIPYCHHEKWDGTGYPRGLKGEQIPLAARLFAVVDVWDALRYRSARGLCRPFSLRFAAM